MIKKKPVVLMLVLLSMVLVACSMPQEFYLWASHSRPTLEMSHDSRVAGEEVRATVDFDVSLKDYAHVPEAQIRVAAGICSTVDDEWGGFCDGELIEELPEGIALVGGDSVILDLGIITVERGAEPIPLEHTVVFTSEVAQEVVVVGYSAIQQSDELGRPGYGFVEGGDERSTEAVVFR